MFKFKNVLFSVFFVLVIFFIPLLVLAQDGEEEAYQHVPFSITFLPNLSTTGFREDNVIKHISINVIGGYAAKVHGLELGAVFNIEKEEVVGFQYAGVLNFVGSSLPGSPEDEAGSAPIQGLAGWQAAGVANGVIGDASLAQTSGVFNYVSGSFTGLQAAGTANFVGGDFTGFQSSGVVNSVLGDVNFAQVSGGMNFALDTVSGVQAAGTLNLAGGINGAQFSVINIGGEIRGVQVGVVNIARRIEGVQVGVVNVSEEMDGAPIGLISAVGNGQFHLNTWASETALVNVGLKMGSKYVYNIFGLGYQPIVQPNQPLRWFPVLGIGGHIPLDPFFVDIDLVSQNVREGPRPWDITFTKETSGLNLLNKVRLTGGWQIIPGLAITAGPTLNVFVSNDQDGSDIPIYDQPIISSSRSGDTRVRIWPGFTLGLQLL